MTRDEFVEQLLKERRGAFAVVTSVESNGQKLRITWLANTSGLMSEDEALIYTLFQAESIADALELR